MSGLCWRKISFAIKCLLLIVLTHALLVILPRHLFLFDQEIYSYSEDYNTLLVDDDAAATTVISHTSGSVTQQPSPVLLLFTTFKITSERFAINNRTLYNWARLQPSVQPVLFTETATDSDLTSRATSLGWAVHVAPQLRSGYPVVSAMFKYCEKIAQKSTQFIGYANSDILFSGDLTVTLKFVADVQSDLSTSERETATFVIGKRSTLTPAEYVKHSDDRAGSQEFTATLNSTSIPRDSRLSIDYFIVSKDTFPWRDVPPFVVGKPGYDNWLVAMAVEWRLRVIDVTQTVPAIHQVVRAKHRDSGWFSSDVCLNRDLVDPFNYDVGHTACALLFTSRDQASRRLRLFQRSRKALQTAGCFPSSFVNHLKRRFLGMNSCAEVADKSKHKFYETLV